MFVALRASPEGCVRLLQHRHRNGLRHDPRAGREEERRGGAVDGGKERELPQLRVAGQEEGRRPGLARPAQEIRRDHHQVAR